MKINQIDCRTLTFAGSSRRQRGADRTIHSGMVREYRSWQRRNDPKVKVLGFSLFEVIVYMAIVGVLLVTVLTIVVQSMTSRTKTMVMQNVLYESQFVLDRLTTDVRAATAIDSTDFNANILTITLADGTTHRYERGGNTITLQVNNQTPVELTSRAVAVTEFVLTNRTTVGASIHDVQITLTTKSVTTNPRPEFNASQTLTTTVSTRL